MAADILIFDPARIQDTATFTNPLSYSQGVDFLLVNGVVVLENDEPTGAKPGLVLRHGQRRRSE
jgi:N-acyl-D-aspartate/D-glutamate deacylase